MGGSVFVSGWVCEGTCMCVWRVCVYVYMYVCVLVDGCECGYVCPCTCVWVCVNLWVCGCGCMCAWGCGVVWVCLWLFMCVRMCVYVRERATKLEVLLINILPGGALSVTQKVWPCELENNIKATKVKLCKMIIQYNW